MNKVKFGWSDVNGRHILSVYDNGIPFTINIACACGPNTRERSNQKTNRYALRFHRSDAEQYGVVVMSVTLLMLQEQR